MQFLVLEAIVFIPHVGTSQTFFGFSEGLERVVMELED